MAHLGSFASTLSLPTEMEEMNNEGDFVGPAKPGDTAVVDGSMFMFIVMNGLSEWHQIGPHDVALRGGFSPPGERFPPPRVFSPNRVTTLPPDPTTLRLNARWKKLLNALSEAVPELRDNPDFIELSREFRPDFHEE